MAQTTGATTARAATVGYSSDGSSWTDISGFAIAVTGASQDRMSGEVYTFDGDTAIIGAGKREPMEIEISYVYTEGGSDPFEVLRPIYEAATAYYFRWTVKAATTGNFRFTTPACYITSFGYPEIEAENAGDPVPGSLTIRPGYVTKAAAP